LKISMKWKIKNNCISELFLGNDNLIYPWGIETADSSAFFSLEDKVGYRYSVLSSASDFGPEQYRGSYEVKMQEGRWQLDIDDKIINSTTIQRSAYLNCLESSHFMDFVVRFRFKKEFFPNAEINGMHYQHKNSNLYYQFPVREAQLTGSRYRVKVSIDEVTCPEVFSPQMYVRDYEDEWVVHARMVPVSWEKEVIKLCNRWAHTRPLPQFFSNALLKVPFIKRQLWYRGERKPFTGPIMRRINPLACPIVKLGQGEVLFWKVTATFNTLFSTS